MEREYEHGGSDSVWIAGPRCHHGMARDEFARRKHVGGLLNERICSRIWFRLRNSDVFDATATFADRDVTSIYATICCMRYRLHHCTNDPLVMNHPAVRRSGSNILTTSTHFDKYVTNSFTLCHTPLA